MAPLSYHSRHSAPTPAPRHRNISQHALQQGYVVKTRKYHHQEYSLADFLQRRRWHPCKPTHKTLPKWAATHTFQPWRPPLSHDRLGAPHLASMQITISQNHWVSFCQGKSCRVGSDRMPLRCHVFGAVRCRVGSQSLSRGFSEIEIFSRITLVRREFSWESMRPSLMRSCDQVSRDLPVEIMLNRPKCTRTTNNPTNNPNTCVVEIRSVTFNKDLDRTGTSKRKQKALLHRERKENAINTRRLEIQKVIVFLSFPVLYLHRT